uniref:Apple domain-containing protein n=1 Tax=Lates calcarifer TaxID=8187 RepID=A0A4W6FTZ3_LATCA
MQFVVLLSCTSVCLFPFPQVCDHQRQENLDFPGSDVAVLFSPDAEHCQYLCTQHPACTSTAFLKSTPSGQPTVQVTKQGITSGFSLRSCHPDPSRYTPCLSQVYQHVDFYGADYRQLFTADYEECQRACTHDPACQFFTFLTDDFTPEKYRYKCHLKFSWPVPRTPEVGGRGWGKLFPKTNLPGHDIESLLAASPEHCQTLCSAHPQCSYFSYSSLLTECAMKTLEGINLPGSDLRFLLVNNAKACQKTCTEDPNCQFYTYTIADRRCYLKRVITMPLLPKVTKLANAVSGFSLRNATISTLYPTIIRQSNKLIIHR